MKKTTLLIILDGFGISHTHQHNAIQLAHTPTLDDLWKNAPHGLLNASGSAVGLPDNQMGNSEVGHLHIGAGRMVPQDLTRINHAIEEGSFFNNPTLHQAIKICKENHKAAHVIGLLSDGGVHSHEKQIAAMIDMIHQAGIKQNYFHAILDGRDTPPKSAKHYLEKIEHQYQRYGDDMGRICSVIGRYYAMDRDQRWDRTKKAYDLLTEGHANYVAQTTLEGLKWAYDAGLSDEFVPPISIHHPNQKPITLENGDIVFFMNFRADRSRSLSHALIDKDFQAFKRNHFPKLNQLVTLTPYAKTIKANIAFQPLKLKNTLGEYVSKHHRHQLRIAETEKYAHVTYFLNGGRETPFPNEDRILIPSPQVATYDQTPNMSAIAITNEIINAIEQQRYDLIVCNFANPDMLGHTGNEIATRKAIECIDQCLSRIIQTLNTYAVEGLITADHGNAEKMYDETTKQAHTAHTTNPVPCIYLGKRKVLYSKKLGILSDIAPTLLHLMDLPIPKEMTGNCLIELAS